MRLGEHLSAIVVLVWALIKISAEKKKKGKKETPFSEGIFWNVFWEENTYLIKVIYRGLNY